MSVRVWGTRNNSDVVEVKDRGWRGRQEPGPREPCVLATDAPVESESLRAAGCRLGEAHEREGKPLPPGSGLRAADLSRENVSPEAQWQKESLGSPFARKPFYPFLIL